MTDRPILFSGPMIRALLEGRKTQTRRVLKPQPKAPKNGRWYRPFPTTDPLNWQYALGDRIHGYLKAPYAVGDRLWVREAHEVVGSMDPGWVLYRASGYEAECARHGFDKPYPPERELKWRPSIHMPRWASRLTLIVTDIRVQRVQEISEADAVAEGVDRDWETGAWWGADGRGVVPGCTSRFTYPRDAFRSLWDSLNAQRGFGWDANPWVIAVSFEVRRVNIDQLQ